MHGYLPTNNKNNNHSNSSNKIPVHSSSAKASRREKKNNDIVITYQRIGEPGNPFQCPPCSNLFNTKLVFLKHLKSMDACCELLLADHVSQAPTTTKTTGADITTAWNNTFEGDRTADADLDVCDPVVQDRNETISTIEQQQHSLGSSVYCMGNATTSPSQESAPDDPQEPHHQQEAIASSKTLQTKIDFMEKESPPPAAPHQSQHHLDRHMKRRSCTGPSQHSEPTPNAPPCSPYDQFRLFTHLHPQQPRPATRRFGPKSPSPTATTRRMEDGGQLAQSKETELGLHD